ncbi:MAG: hypothetical protein E7437_04870 [Ruminococcaceae bacterium]|nr:hypothetical protein [Oscillospiraceae bacterium]
MNEKRIRLLYGILLSVSLVAAAVCLMVACVNIYYSGGEQVYTPEKVATAFRGIAIPVYLAVALIFGGFLLHMLLPHEKLRIKLGKNEPLILKKLHEKQDFTRCGDDRIRNAIHTEQKTRKQLRWGSIAMFAAGSVAFLCYALRFDRYQLDDINGAVIRGTVMLLVCLTVPFIMGIFATVQSRRSIRREIALMKLVAAPRQTEPQAAVKKDKTWIARTVILCVAVGCIVGGFLFDGWADVLTKAINICTECVGLG